VGVLTVSASKRTFVSAGCASGKASPVCAAIRVPEARIYAIDVSFATLKDTAELDFLNWQPTSCARSARSSPSRPTSSGC